MAAPIEGAAGTKSYEEVAEPKHIFTPRPAQPFRRLGDVTAEIVDGLIRRRAQRARPFIEGGRDG